MTTKEILIAARAKIEAPERWTQGEFARSKIDRRVKATSDRAECWCIMGAVDAVVKNDPDRFRDANLAVGHAIGIRELREIADWNDDPARTHAEVLAAFDRAIAAADSV